MTTFAGWGTLLVTLLVCGLGLRLTFIQYRDVSGILRDVQKRTAEAERIGLERFLGETERQVLGDLAAAADDAGALASLIQRQPILEAPFFFSTDGAFVSPHLGKMRGPTLLSDELVPIEFEKALRIAWSQAPLEDKAQALEDIYRSEGMAPPWRLRALSALAALQAKAGDPALAAERYKSIFHEFEPMLLESTSPSYLQLVIARNDCLVLAGRPQEARDLTVKALEKMGSKATESSFAEEQFFLDRARDLFLKTGGEAPSLLKEMEQLHREKEHSLRVLEALRDSILKISYGETKAPEDGEPRHFFEEGEPPILTVWMRRTPPPSGPGLAAAGFRMNLTRLEELLNEHLLRVAPESHLVVKASSQVGDRFLPLTVLGSDRGFLRIGLEREVWNDLVGKARRPFLFAGILIGVLAILLTLGLITFFRGLRREMALSRMKTEFVANVSHELKTPLALIRLFGETLLLERVEDPEQRKKYLQTITRESERLTHLISNVLNFASIEAGKKSYQLVPCDLGDAVRVTYESYRPHLDEKGFTHRLNLAPGLPKVLADADAVSQAVINLLENAVKYSPQKKDVTLAVSGGDGSVEISVVDRGVGISQEDQARIWEGYYRTREARALGTRGSGLGLSLVRHILNAHGGRVKLESQTGKGSVFTLIFPVAPLSRDQAPMQAEGF